MFYANYIVCACGAHIIYFVLETENGTQISFAGDHSNCLFVTYWYTYIVDIVLPVWLRCQINVSCNL